MRTVIIGNSGSGKTWLSRQLGNRSEEGLKALIEWAEGYLSRQGPSGRASHSLLFELFAGERHRFESEVQVLAFVSAA